MLRAVLRCLRSPRSCAVRLVQRRSKDYRYFHVQKKASQRETRRIERGSPLERDLFGPQRPREQG